MRRRSTALLIGLFCLGSHGVARAAPRTRDAEQSEASTRPRSSEDAKREGQEDAHGGAPLVPEPMVFDLVRPLGARQWELEVNSLFMVPLVRGGWSLDWAPEIELALLDGFAIELELPMENEHVAALKGAAQLTFGHTGPFVHGVQWITERFLRDDERIENTLVYIAAARLDPTWSVLGMVGARVATGTQEEAPELDTVLNLNLFAHLGQAAFGIELNHSHTFGHDSRLLVMPQLHLPLGEHLHWQLGLGVEVDPRPHAVAGTRIIGEL